jgi:hypothetical protein
MASTAERQRQFRNRMEAEGFIQVTGWVPAAKASEVRILMQQLCKHPELEPGPLRNSETGKLIARYK